VKEVIQLTKQPYRHLVTIFVIAMSILTIWSGRKPTLAAMRGWSAARRSKEIIREASYYQWVGIDPRTVTPISVAA